MDVVECRDRATCGTTHGRPLRTGGPRARRLAATSANRRSHVGIGAEAGHDENRSGNPASGEDAEVENSVLAYLHGHPQAADTLRGIVNWWLPRQRYENDCQRIEQALGGWCCKACCTATRCPEAKCCTR